MAIRCAAAAERGGLIKKKSFYRFCDSRYDNTPGARLVGVANMHVA